MIYALKNIFVDVVLLAVSVFLTSCASSKHAEQTASQESIPSHRDTVEVEVLTPVRADTSHALSMKPAQPSKLYTVQIGAFQVKENAERWQKYAQERFHEPVRLTVEGNLYKVSVGTFPTYEEAQKFRLDIVKRYGDEYRDAWVAELKE